MGLLMDDESDDVLIISLLIDETVEEVELRMFVFEEIPFTID
jgi:hypothetical protein